ncbi:MAG: undecaprenyl/decaprenyl-phosphate alpha-N-acetylglucosaminyl 1-phosphate transferase [Sedimentisphaerales bacterium]|nr:undecaprenyl/decaprenyl-phosphate alpha-N-acetylglucosaminyl 1-phosphate transferase [Sedimentisphaerales bacterium]
MSVNNVLEILGREPVLIVAGSVFLMALTAGTILTSFMLRLSIRWGAVDKPDGDLKQHSRATATLGGIPLFLALAGTVLWLKITGAGFLPGVIGRLDWDLAQAGLLVGGLIILLMGVRDDLCHVMPRNKLIFQILAALVVVASGLVVTRCGFFDVFELPLGLLAVPFTLFWLVGSCNAFNFIDGMDGLATGIGVVISLLLAVLGFLTGEYGAAMLSMALAGALSGVLFFNVKPAMIFLGDSGSQLIGLLLGALTIKVATTGGVFALPTAGLLLSVPILDAFLSILRRYSEHESPIRGDHKHIHHCLRRLGLRVNIVSLMLCLAVLVAGGMGIVFRFTTGAAAAAAAAALVGLQLYLGVRLGCLDPRKLMGRLTGTYRWEKLTLPGKTSNGRAELDVFWERMKPLFEQMHLDRAILTLEGVGVEGRTQYETYQWVRSEAEQMAELLASRWTKRFTFNGSDDHRVATLRLESAEQLRRDEERIEWLLKQIRHNMQFVSCNQQQQEEVEV